MSLITVIMRSYGADLEKANGTFQFPSLIDSLSILSRKQMGLPE